MYRETSRERERVIFVQRERERERERENKKCLCENWSNVKAAMERVESGRKIFEGSGNAFRERDRREV